MSGWKNSEEEIRNLVVEELSLDESVTETGLLRKINEQLVNESSEYVRLQEKKKLRRQVFNSIRRMDVLQDFLEDDEITEIMVNGANQIFVEKNGVLLSTSQRFSSEEKLYEIIGQIASAGNRIVNESSPILDVRLEDGSRVNVVLPPLALNGPVITIRRFPKEALTMDKLVMLGAITKQAAAFLEKLVRAKYNIFISGGTGAGKTTFLNILSGFIPRNERVITIEDSAELQIQHVDNLVRLETRMANIEGENAISIRDLLKSALRMRPDRVIVGEVRDEVAIDMLQAMNTGHDGSLSTGHANTARDMLNRLETLVLMGLDIPLQAVRGQIASALDLIVHVGRLRDGSRKVLQIAEVGEVKKGEIELIPLYEFEEVGEMDGKVLGSLQPTGNRLYKEEKLRREGICCDSISGISLE